MTADEPDKFLPGRHLIEGFGDGGFRFGGMSHQGSLLIVPSGMRALPVKDVGSLKPEHLSLLVAEKSEIDFVLIGVGGKIGPLPKAVRELLSAAAINYDVMDTRAAARTYNVVLAEDRRVAAVLLAVEDV